MHRTDCTNAASLHVAARAAASRSSGRRPAQSMFLVNIQVEALDRARLLSDITMVLSDAHVNILSASLSHHPRPGRQEPVHLRDGRRQAPRRTCSGRPLRAGRLRRLPRHRSDASSRARRSLGRTQPSARRDSCRVGDAVAAACADAVSRSRPRPAGPCRGTTGGRRGSASSSLTLLVVAGGRRLVEVGLDVGDARPRAWRPCRRRGPDFSGSERRHCSSSTPRMACSTLRIRPSSSFIRSRGTLPAASQRSAMSRKVSLGGLEVGDRDAAPRPRRAAPP